MFHRLLCDRAGATAIEYAFVAMLVSIAAVSAYGSIGYSVANFFEQISASF